MPKTKLSWSGKLDKSIADCILPESALNIVCVLKQRTLIVGGRTTTWMVSSLTRLDLYIVKLLNWKPAAVVCGRLVYCRTNMKSFEFSAKQQSAAHAYNVNVPLLIPDVPDQRASLSQALVMPFEHSFWLALKWTS